MKRIIIIISIVTLFFSCSNGEKKAVSDQNSVEKKTTLADIQSGTTTAALTELLGEPQSKDELGFGVSRWYYSDTSFAAIIDDTVHNVVLSVAQAEKEIKAMFD